MTSRALALLAAFASPLFMGAAVAGWLYDLWPATPLTLSVASFLVIFGPVLGIWHVATADEDWDDEEEIVAEPKFVATPVINVAEARARAFHNWRDSSNPAIEQRDRARRANQYVRS